MKIKYMIFILFFCLSIIPIMLFGILNMRYYNNKMEHVLENNLKTATSTIASAIDYFFEERDINLTVVSDYDMVHQLLELLNLNGNLYHTHIRVYVDNMLKTRIEHNDYLESLTVMDTKFRIIACSEKVKDGEISVLKEAQIDLDKEGIIVTPVLDAGGKGNKEKIAAVVKPIYENNKKVGYIVEELNMKFFEEIRQSANLFNNGTIYLMDDNGKLVTAGDNHSSRQELVLNQKERADFNRAWEERDKDSKEGTIQYQVKNDRFLTCYIQLEHANWILLASVNIDEILQTKMIYRRLLIIVAGVVVLLLLGVNYLVSTKIAKPLENMVKKFNQIKETKDYSIRMDLPKKNEIGNIAKEINSLLAHIEDNIKMEKQKQNSLKEKVLKDPLTNLYNKKEIERISEKQLKAAQRGEKKIAFVFIDVDDFKDFNTQYGHIGGDNVLIFIAQVLKEIFQSPAGRVGGDEFMLCIDREQEVEEIELLVKKTLERLNQGTIIEEDGNNIPIFCSVGVALSYSTETTLKELIAAADEAMYQVKNENKNSYLII